MAAAGALNVVKQIQALAEGPRTPEMRECLGQVVSSLLFFLDHPDSRVRLSAARTLVKLSNGYREDMQRFDMSRARSALARCKNAEAEGIASVDSEELRRLLGEILEEAGSEDPRPSSSIASLSAAPAPDARAAAATSSTTGASDVGAAAPDGRGQVVLKVGHSTDGRLKAAILEKVVVLPGVVSVTFEGLFVIVATKTSATAADAGFLAELLTAVQAQGLQGVSLVSAANAGGAGAAAGLAGHPTSLDESGPGGSACSRAAAGAEDALGEAAEAEDEEDEAEPAYLDDDEDEVAAPSGAFGAGPGAPVGLSGGSTWTFFSQTNWMTGRRLQEFGDDPTIAARLAKAKKREEDRREEERSRIGRISSWLLGGR
uniref:Uncharacterized protein n=1 Tax=Alexandrium monilatum TaxID=311494 RepID=A0A7S4Q7M2_9DINO|mmetsp:Transcript_81365/g.242506  ORF Transcript_81365/g.242506 Transcript_81365/m.242506 type:complete len:373 (+) Transcript_81365:140-1258(+)